MEVLDFANAKATEARVASTCLACSAFVEPETLYTVAGYEIKRCPSCGLGRTVMPSGFDPTQIYNESYFQGGHSDGYADYQGSRKSLAIEFQHVLQDMAKAGVTSGRLLEVGCAYGYFLDEARASFETCGIELAQEAVSACRDRGLDVVQHADESFFSSREPFDAVVMLDVIEHLEDPDNVLRDLHSHMKEGAMLVLTTGDFGSRVARAMGRRWRLMTPPQHLWYFTTEAMTKLLEAHGFRVTAISHPTKRVPLSLIAYQLSRYVGAQRFLKNHSLPGSIPVNLFDAMRVFARRC